VQFTFADIKYSTHDGYIIETYVRH